MAVRVPSVSNRSASRFPRARLKSDWQPQWAIQIGLATKCATEIGLASPPVRDSIPTSELTLAWMVWSELSWVGHLWLGGRRWGEQKSVTILESPRWDSVANNIGKYFFRQVIFFCKKQSKALPFPNIYKVLTKKWFDCKSWLFSKVVLRNFYG